MLPYYYLLKRLFDLFTAILGLLLLLPIIIIVALCVKFTSQGPVLYWSDRVGKENKIFRMPKFRSMQIETPDVATHLLDDPLQYLTSIGGFIRATSLDELPQLWNVIKGEMSLVGPRPALYNQDDLIALRTEKGIHLLKPGVTGWAQINGRDELPIPDKVILDEEYMQRQTLWFDIKIILLTIYKVIKRDSVTH